MQYSSAHSLSLAVGAAALLAPVALRLLRCRRLAAALVDGAMAMLAAGDADAAVEAFEAALELRPRLRPLLWQRGLALFFAGRFAEAAAQFELGMAANPDDAEEAMEYDSTVNHSVCKNKQACTLRMPAGAGGRKRARPAGGYARLAKGP